MSVKNHGDRRGGAPMHISPAERREIQLVRLTDRSCRSISACARKFGRRRDAIKRCFRGADFEALQKQVETEQIAEARAVLRQGWRKAAEAWTETALLAAAEKGDHRAARDLLLHGNVIEPIDDTYVGPQVVVQIGAKDSDVTVGIPQRKEK